MRTSVLAAQGDSCALFRAGLAQTSETILCFVPIFGRSRLELGRLRSDLARLGPHLCAIWDELGMTSVTLCLDSATSAPLDRWPYFAPISAKLGRARRFGPNFARLLGHWPKSDRFQQKMSRLRPLLTDSGRIWHDWHDEAIGWPDSATFRRLQPQLWPKHALDPMLWPGALSRSSDVEPRASFNVVGGPRCLRSFWTTFGGPNPL